MKSRTSAWCGQFVSIFIVILEVACKWSEASAQTSCDCGLHDTYVRGRVISAKQGPVEIRGVDGFSVTGQLGAGAYPGSSMKSRFFFYPNRGALRGGVILGTQWDPTNIGEASIGFGKNSLASGLYSSVSGGIDNAARGEAAVVAGGSQNTAGTVHCFVGGGYQNRSENRASVVVGGVGNLAGISPSGVVGGSHAAVVGGEDNTASGSHSFVGGGGGQNVGEGNAAKGDYSVIGGGVSNTASGAYSSVLGGRGNNATGSYSLAAGRQASAAHDGAFVWADAQAIPFASTQTNQFLIRASNGVGIGTASPQQQLDVAGTIKMDGFLMPTAPGVGYVLTSDANGRGQWSAPSPVDDGDWTIAGADMYSSVPGNVGIGTNSPMAKLDVAGDARIRNSEFVGQFIVLDGPNGVLELNHPAQPGNNVEMSVRLGWPAGLTGPCPLPDIASDPVPVQISNNGFHLLRLSNLAPGGETWDIAIADMNVDPGIDPGTFSIGHILCPRGSGIGQGPHVSVITATKDGNVGIGTTKPGASSLMELSSTTKGFVLPRMTKAQRDAIGSPVPGMAVYQTDNTPGLRVYNGTNWMRFTETAD
jgi:hypothetical protein